jgi:putative ABC transport system permease protein
MDAIRIFWNRFVGFFRKKKLDSELDAEFRAHLEELTEENIRRGLSPEEARYAARREFGGIEQTKELYREQRGLPFFESLFQDLRFAVRLLIKNPGYTAVAVLTLALGIGANTAIFSLVNGILLEPLAYPQADRLVSVTGTYPRGAFVAMSKQVHSLDVAAYAEGHDFNLTGRGEPVRLTGTLVSDRFFSVLGAKPELGRTFLPGEDVAGQDQYVVLSHALWKERFASDPSIIGRPIDLEGVSRQVIGVMPADFRFPSSKTQVWIPLHNDPRDTTSYWASDFMPVIGRLHPDATIAQARTEIRLFQSRVFSLFPWPMPADWNAGVSVIPLQEGMVSDVRARLLILLGAVVFVLLIACANVANLALSRAAMREKEIAIRCSLGAVRLRLIRQLLTESVLLAALGGLLGLFLAYEGIQFLRAALPADTPRLSNVHLDWRVLAFTAVIALLTGLLFGVAPSLHSSRISLVESLKSGGRGSSGSVSNRMRGSLVIAEVAFAVLLVVAAGLLIRSFWALSHVNPGFHSEHVLTARITPNESFCNNAPRCLSFYSALLQQVDALPGVASAALVNTLPLGGRVAKRSLDIENHLVPAGEDSPLFWLDVVSPDYFRAMGITILSGRGFAESDSSGAPVAVISAATARRYWPNQNALGKHIRLLNEKDWRTIIGVVQDVRAYDLQRSIPAWIHGTAYVPYNTSATLEDRRIPAEMTLVLRTVSDAGQMAASLRRTVAALNPEVPVSEIKPMQTIVSEAISAPASTTSLFVLFAGLALALGIIGIYGVLSYLVSRRTREIGIRVALGAQRRVVLWLVIKEGLKFSLAGLAIGFLGAFALSRFLSSELFGVSPADPLTYFGVSFVLIVVTLLACYVPARRAMRVDPITVLRME